MFVIVPHNDDESLFTAYTIIRHKPKVIIVTDSYRQDWTTAIERRQETIDAMKLVGIVPEFLGIRDTNIPTYIDFRITESEKVLIPYPEKGGNPDHNLIGKICADIFPNHTFYSTYTKDRLYPTGNIEIKPTKKEMRLKNKMLACYKSQLEKNKPHFEAVRNKSEYYET